MNAEEIKKIIQEEIKSEKDLTKVFGLDLTKCLIEPILEKYRDSSGNVSEFWTVLEESEDKSGYKIYYDNQTKEFGLGMRNDDGLLDIGLHGTFLKTIYSM